MTILVSSFYPKLTIDIKERATVCIRLLMEDNEANQSFVRGMASISDRQ
jgi:Spinocerebellar ataxia type 10 protein domain